jgi:DNA polymerase III epsilon subunit-like protein
MTDPHPTLFGDDEEPACFSLWWRYGGAKVVKTLPEIPQEDFFQALPPSLETTPLCFVDVETTGLNKELDRVIQLAVTRIEPTGEVSEYVSYFNPEGRPNEGWKVNQIPDWKTKRAPLFRDEIKPISWILGDALLVAHNAKACDEPMLRREFLRAGAAWPCLGVIDTLPLARSIWTDTKHSLGVLADYLGVHQGAAHDAAGDVETLMGIWHKIKEARPSLTLAQLIDMKAAKLTEAA